MTTKVDVMMTLMQAKSKGKQAANDFVVERYSSSPTTDYFDPLKKPKLKSFEDLKAVRNVHNKDIYIFLLVRIVMYSVHGWHFSDSFARST